MGRVYGHHTLSHSLSPSYLQSPISSFAYFLRHGEVGVISRDQLSRNQPS